MTSVPGVLCVSQDLMLLPSNHCCEIQKCYQLWSCRLAHSGLQRGCDQLCDLLALTCDETHKGDAAAVSVHSQASAANPPSVGRYKCEPSLWPSTALGWWISWCFRPLDKSLHCPYLHMQDTMCAWGEGGVCVWSSWKSLLLVTLASLLLCSSLVPV